MSLKGRLKPVVDYTVYFLLRVVVCLIQTVSLETCATVARYLSYVLADLVRLRDQTVEDNLKIALPSLADREKRVLKRRMWEHLTLLICEIAHAPRKLRQTNWLNYVTIEGRREIVSYLLDNRPVIIVSGHFGNFEVGGYLVGLLGFPTHTIARTLDNPYVDRFVRAFRERKGQFILPKDGSAAQVAELLQSGGTVTILADQHAGPKGCWVDFMGQPTSCHKAVALFTLSSGAPMLVISNARSGKPLHYTVRLEGLAEPHELGEGLASVPGMTRWYNQCLEAAIRRTPDQYWWLHRRWRGDPPARKSAKVAVDASTESQRPAA